MFRPSTQTAPRPQLEGTRAVRVPVPSICDRPCRAERSAGRNGGVAGQIRPAWSRACGRPRVRLGQRSPASVEESAYSGKSDRLGRNSPEDTDIVPTELGGAASAEDAAEAGRVRPRCKFGREV